MSSVSLRPRMVGGLANDSTSSHHHHARARLDAISLLGDYLFYLSEAGDRPSVHSTDRRCHKTDFQVLTATDGVIPRGNWHNASTC